MWSWGARTRLLGKQGLFSEPWGSSSPEPAEQSPGLKCECRALAALHPSPLHPSPLCTPTEAQHSVAVQPLLALRMDSFMFLGCFQSMLSSRIQNRAQKQKLGARSFFLDSCAHSTWKPLRQPHRNPAQPGAWMQVGSMDVKFQFNPLARGLIPEL